MTRRNLDWKVGGNPGLRDPQTGLRPCWEDFFSASIYICILYVYIRKRIYIIEIFRLFSLVGFDVKVRECILCFYLVERPPTWVEPLPEIWRDLLLLERPGSPRNGSPLPPIAIEETLASVELHSEVKLVGLIEGGSSGLSIMWNALPSQYLFCLSWV